jgi:SAM-dependent methyltransferase
MNVAPYSVLASYYEADWSSFSKSYLSLLKNLNISPKRISSSALDIACGTGVLAAALAKEGYTVIGVDLSSQMLEVAHNSYPELEFLLADMRTFDLQKKFDLVTCSFDSLNYLLTEEDLRLAFGRVAEHLLTGGNFLFDLNTAKLYEDKQHGTIQRLINGVSFEQRLFYDSLTRQSRTVFSFPSGETEEHIQRPYDPDEVALAIQGTGLEIVRSFINDRLDPPNESTYKTFYLAQISSRGGFLTQA